MASIQVAQSGGGGRRRTLDAEINLVPFIDLLSMCICFLLMTAVWTQLSAVQVKQAVGTEGSAAATPQLQLDAKFVSAGSANSGPQGGSGWRLALGLKRGGRTLRTLEAADFVGMENALKTLRSGLAPGEEIGSVMLTPREGIEYGTLIGAMDVLRRNRLVNIGVVPVAPAGQPGAGAR